MLNLTNSSGGIALDANGLNDLKRTAKDNSPESIKATAKQFEAMFMNMILKSMRDATPQEGPFDSEQSRSFTAMLDQQLSQNLAGKGLGLADVLVKQLSKTPGLIPDATTSKIGSAANNLHLSAYVAIAAMTQQPDLNTKPSKAGTTSEDHLPSDDENVDVLESAVPSTLSPNQHNRQAQTIDRKTFQQNVIAAAQEISLASGIPTQYLIGQAALESGWGQHEIKGDDGNQSFNLFGLKATGGWKGKVASTITTEYLNGSKQKRVQKFRAYDSYVESFKDFANLIRKNPRYNNVIGNGQGVSDYAQAIQKGGYATDPQYANKLSRTIHLADAS